VGGHAFRAVIGGERLGEGARPQLGQQACVLGVGATNRQVRILTHTIYPYINEAAERSPSAATKNSCHALHICKSTAWRLLSGGLALPTQDKGQPGAKIYLMSLHFPIKAKLYAILYSDSYPDLISVNHRLKFW